MSQRSFISENMFVQVRILGNLLKGLQRQYDDLPLEDDAKLIDLFNHLNIKKELLVVADRERLSMDAPLYDGMQITIISPSAGG